MQDLERLVEAMARGLAQGIIGARPVPTKQAKQRKPRSIPQPKQEEMFPMPDFGREEVSPQQFAQTIERMEQEFSDRPVRKPSPPPPKEFPGDEQYPKMTSDTYQPSREDDTQGQATGLPWRA